MVFVRSMAMVFIALSVVFVCLWFYARAARRAELEARWERDQGPGRRESFLNAEMAQYEAALKRKLVWGVYVIPGIVVAVLIYWTTNN